MKLVPFVVMMLVVNLFASKPYFPDVEALKTDTYYSYCGNGKVPMNKYPYLFIAKTEVSNFQWQEYAHVSGDKNVLPDTTQWNSDQLSLRYMDPMVKHYYRHPAYRNYPVVNVSRDQVEAYCEWMTKIWNENLKNQDAPYKKVIVRLPTEEEWKLAARSGDEESNEVYPWEGSSLMVQEKGKFQGRSRANYKRGKTFSIGVNGYLNDNADLTAPVVSYLPNELGLYNMSGNVAEMVKGDKVKGGSWYDGGYHLRIDSDSPYDGIRDAHPCIGFRYIIEVLEMNEDYLFKKDKKADWTSFVSDAKYWEKQMKYIIAKDGVTEADGPQAKYLQPKRIESFYMGQTEVTNFQYQLFLNSMDEKGKLEHSPKSENWKNHRPYNYFTIMHDNPLYENHPVVNIEYESALAYCEWLTAHYNSMKGRKHDKVKFRLATAQEWEHAAMGGKKNSPYPWGGPYVRNAKGCFLANHSPLVPEYQDLTSGEYKYPNGDSTISSSLDGVKFLAKVDSYWANGFGLYNMSGNAAEMVEGKGATKGGSWSSNSYYLHIPSAESYSVANCSTGFRVVMEVVSAI